MVIIAFQVQSERMRPDSMVAQASGITALWVELDGNMRSAEQAMAPEQEMAPTNHLAASVPCHLLFSTTLASTRMVIPRAPMFVGGRGASMRNQS